MPSAVGRGTKSLFAEILVSTHNYRFSWSKQTKRVLYKWP